MKFYTRSAYSLGCERDSSDRIWNEQKKTSVWMAEKTANNATTNDDYASEIFGLCVYNSACACRCLCSVAPRWKPTSSSSSSSYAERQQQQQLRKRHAMFTHIEHTHTIKCHTIDPSADERAVMNMHERVRIHESTRVESMGAQQTHTHTTTSAYVYTRIVAHRNVYLEESNGTTATCASTAHTHTQSNTVRNVYVCVLCPMHNPHCTLYWRGVRIHGVCECENGVWTSSKQAFLWNTLWLESAAIVEKNF